MPPNWADPRMAESPPDRALVRALGTAARTTVAVYLRSGMRTAASATSHAAATVPRTSRHRRRYGRTSTASGSSGSTGRAAAVVISRGIVEGIAVERRETIDHAFDGEVVGAGARHRPCSAKGIGRLHEIFDRTRECIRCWLIDNRPVAPVDHAVECPADRRRHDSATGIQPLEHNVREAFVLARHEQDVHG